MQSMPAIACSTRLTPAYSQESVARNQNHPPYLVLASAEPVVEHAPRVPVPLVGLKEALDGAVAVVLADSGGVLAVLVEPGTALWVV